MLLVADRRWVRRGIAHLDDSNSHLGKRIPQQDNGLID
jgi:hypothetical protein